MKKFSVWLSAFILAIALGATTVLGITSLSANAEETGDPPVAETTPDDPTPEPEPTGTLYYFVNCGAEYKTDIESGLALDKATLGYGDAAKGDNAFGYTQAGTTANGDGLDSTRSNATYAFTLPTGDYRVVVSGANIGVSVDGGSAVPANANGLAVAQGTAEADDTVISVEITGAARYVAVTDTVGKVLLDVHSVSDEILYYGDIVDSKATGYFSDGTKADVPVVWSNLNANDLNKNFTFLQVAGNVKGTEYTVSRNLFTMPHGLVYFINAASYTNDQATLEDLNAIKPEAGTSNDIYYDMSMTVLTTYESGGVLKNDIPDQKISNDRSWGYTEYRSPYTVSSQQYPKKPGDKAPSAFPYNTVRYSERTDSNYDIEYTMGNLDDGTYTLYMGEYSHWHPRNLTPVINGERAAAFNSGAVPKVVEFSSITAQSGKITVKLLGASQDEANVAFIALQKQEAADSVVDAPQTPTFDTDTVDMGTKTFTVGNATVGSKMQVSNGNSPYNVLYEKTVEAVNEDGTYTVDIDAERMEGVFQIRIAAVTNGGASDYVTIFITDVQSLTVTPDITDWTDGDVTYTVRARASSGLRLLKIERGTYVYNIDLSGVECEYPFVVHENDTYSFTVYSNIDAFLTQVVHVGHIDPADVSLAVNLAKGSYDDGKMHVVPVYTGIAAAKAWQLYQNGVVKESGEGAPASLALGKGRYTLRVESLSGKVATQNIVVTEKPTYFTATTAKVRGGISYTLLGVNGKTVRRFSAYGIDSGEQLMPIGDMFEEYDKSAVAVKVEFTDNTNEFVRIAYAPVAEKKSGKKGCGGAAAASSVLLALAALAAACGITAARRRAKTATK